MILNDKFLRCLRNAAYVVPELQWLESVRRVLGEQVTGYGDWLAAAELATVRCPDCKGTGKYNWGKCGVCFRCGGKGAQGQADFVRNRTYDSHRKAV